jgi:hypothetical protein
MTAAAAPPSPPAVTVRLGRGVATAQTWLGEPAGVIRVYRIVAPRGVRATARVQLPHVTVPLEIRTAHFGPTSSCTHAGARVSCSVGEEWCPMPAGVWSVVIRKRAGPAGPITLRLVVSRA